MMVKEVKQGLGGFSFFSASWHAMGDRFYIIYSPVFRWVIRSHFRYFKKYIHTGVPQGSNLGPL